MRFEYIQVLWLLPVVVGGLAAFFWWARREKRRVMDNFVSPRLRSQLLSGISPGFQKLHSWLLIVAAGLLVVALARPQIGFDWQEVRQRGLDIIIAIDTSRSMLAEDVSPNRLARAKLAALDLRRLAKADRMGLVAFAGTAFLQCPLSSDDEAFRQSVNELNVNIIPQGGTALAEAIQTARAGFREKSDNHKVLVIFTDGEENEGNALDAAKEAAKDGLHIFTIGVGTPNGELLRVTDARGRSDYIKDSEGNVVKSRLNDSLLTDIAKATQGFYILLGGANTMNILYQRGLAPLPKGEGASRQIKAWHERFQWVLFFAIVLLGAEMFVPERKLSSRKAVSPAAELAKAALLFLCCLLPVSVSAASASKALKHYDNGKFDWSLHQYQDLLLKEPNDPRLNFNAGDAAFQAGFYDRAQKYFNAAMATEDLPLQERSLYNLGNTHYRLGDEEKDPSKKQANWEQSITSYESALKLDPKDSDAQHNLELVKKKLEELKQQQQKQKDNQKQDKSDDKDKQDQQKDQQQKDQKQDQQEKKQQDQQQKDQQKQDQQQQNQPDQKKPEDQQQAQKPDDKQDNKDQSQQQQPGDKDQEDEQEPQQPGQVKKIQMTPQQALRLLEAAKNEERTMIFVPPQKTNRQDRVFKDW